MKLRRLILIAILGASLACAAPLFAQQMMTQQMMAQQTSPNSSSSPSMQQDSQPGSMANSANKGATKIKGCIRSEHGNYLLESKRHKVVALTGSEDFAPHVGHTVTLYGNFLPGTAMGGAAGANGKSAPSANFQVSKMEMVSETCALDQKDSKNKTTAQDQK